MHVVELAMHFPALILRTGILFPSSYLQNRTFLICFSFVAVNTLIYLGLMLIKLLPRPKPRFLMHPKDIRRPRKKDFP